jgi:hypothetical protein
MIVEEVAHFTPFPDHGAGHHDRPTERVGESKAEGGSVTELTFQASDYVLLAARMRVEARYSGSWAADDLRLADKWEAQARTKQLPDAGFMIRF